MGWYKDLFDRYPLPWKMTVAERFILLGLLDHLRPSCAIEVGTAGGGSLQVLSAAAGKVYSLDIDPTTPDRLRGFPNVEFRIGDSRETLPRLLDELRAQRTPYPFVLIDGDHRADGVRRDIGCLLTAPPPTRTYVLMHDSFNPDCREGIRTAGWEACPFVHEVELDVVPGWFHLPDDGTNLTHEMWAGFALAVLAPHARAHRLVIGESQGLTFLRMAEVSAHRAAWRSAQGLRPT
jgi:hypothetical protein